MVDWKYYVDKRTIGMLWDGTTSMPELNDALSHKKERRQEFYTSVIAPAHLLDELERTSLPRVAAAKKEFHKLFVRAKASIKLISVHQLVSAKRGTWAEKARLHKFDLPFETAIELATAEFAQVRSYITSIDDEEEFADLVVFVEKSTQQFEVIRPSAISHHVQWDFDLDSSEGAPGGQPTGSPTAGTGDAGAASGSVLGLLGAKRKPTE